MSQYSSPSIFGSSQLTNFIFNFIGSPFKSIHKKLTPVQPQTNQPVTHASTENVHQDSPPTHHEPIPNHKPMQNEPSFTPHQIDQPVSSIENLLPTAFMPRFPSLSKTSTRPLPSNHSDIYFARLSSTGSFPSTQSRRPSRRNLYIGPGHSSMNSSSRLDVARRKRLGTSKSACMFGSNYDAASQVSPESPKRAHPSSNHSLDSSEEQILARTQLNRHHHHMHSRPVSPFRNHHHSEASHNGAPSPAPPEADNSYLRSINNPNVTAMTPSALRNSTLPSDSSPDPQVMPSSRPQKRTHKQAALIMSSVMKEVTLEISNRSPAPSPIKPSQVINPYALLQQRPIKQKPTSQSALVKDPPIHPTNNIHQSDNRKRRVEVCLDGDGANHPSNLAKCDPIDHLNSNHERIEQNLQTTIPKEFRPRQSSSNESVKKRKTGVIGKLSERALKKQKLREHTSSGSRDINPTKTTTIIPKTQPSTTDQFQLKLNRLDNSNAPALLSTTKNFQTESSSLTLESSNINPHSTSKRSSLLIAKHPSSLNERNQKNPSYFSVPNSSQTESGGGVLLLKQSDQHLHSPIHCNINHPQALNEAKTQAKGVGKDEHKGKEKGEEKSARPEGTDELIADDTSTIMNLVKELTEDEIRKHFNRELSIDESNPSIYSSLTKSNNSSNRLDLAFESVKQVVLGFNFSELKSFALI